MAIDDSRILIIFYKNGVRHAGTISENIYPDVLFPIFLKNLVPLSDEEAKLMIKFPRVIEN